MVSLFTPISSNNNNDRHNLIDIFLKATFSTNYKNPVPVQFRIGSPEALTTSYPFLI
jgi:hypothetical protein